MQTFERSVLIVALLILIVTLTVMGIALKQNAGKGNAVASACPDFWFSSYYQPCSMSNFGCCSNGITPANESGSNCESAVNCNSTEFGCCPDGFTTQTTSDGVNCPQQGTSMCYNVKSLPEKPVEGTCKMMDPLTEFTVEGGNSLLCSKQKWAKKCQVSWDGVSNIDNACN